MAGCLRASGRNGAEGAAVGYGARAAEVHMCHVAAEAEAYWQEC